MRFSPLLAAVFAVSATLGLSAAADGETSGSDFVSSSLGKPEKEFEKSGSGLQLSKGQLSKGQPLSIELSTIQLSKSGFSKASFSQSQFEPLPLTLQDKPQSKIGRLAVESLQDGQHQKFLSAKALSRDFLSHESSSSLELALGKAPDKYLNSAPLRLDKAETKQFHLESTTTDSVAATPITTASEEEELAPGEAQLRELGTISLEGIPDIALNKVVLEKAFPLNGVALNRNTPSITLAQSEIESAPSEISPEIDTFPTQGVPTEVPDDSAPTESVPTELPDDVAPTEEVVPDPNLESPAPPSDLPSDLQPEPSIPGIEPPSAAPAQPGEPQVLVAEVVVAGVDDEEVENRIYDAIATRPGFPTTRSQLQQDINSIFAIGLFRNVRAIPEDTPLGVRVTFQVEPNPVLQGVVFEGNQVLPQEVIDEAFAGQLNQTINLNQVEEAIRTINDWYQSNGYVLAQVIAAPQVTADGTITLTVAEGVIEDIRVQYFNRDGEATDEDGNIIEGNTKEYIITREIELQPGDVFNQAVAQRDLGRVFGLGIFEDVQLQLEPGEADPEKAIMVVNITESSTGSVALGGGVSSASGLFGTVSYQESNLGGNNQRVGLDVQLGERILLLDLSFTDPWIGGDPNRTSYTVNVFRRRSISTIFEPGPDEDDEVRLPNGDRPRVIRTGGGITFTRPFAESVFVDPDFVASLGLQYQRVQITDADIDVTPRDDAGKLLSASDSGEDDLITLQFGIAQDRRNNVQFPTSGYTFRVGTEQSIPLGSGSIFYNRLRGSFNFYAPVDILNFIPDAPEALAFSLQAGTIVGDFPPYEAFPIGGANTVRGWEEGALAAARSFVLGSVEYRFPIFSVGNFLIGGALFVDASTALGTQSTVQGNPGGIRGKPGTGLGFGGGLRVQSPLGPIRIDYGINNLGDGRIHFGIGERF